MNRDQLLVLRDRLSLRKVHKETTPVLHGVPSSLSVVAISVRT